MLAVPARKASLGRLSAAFVRLVLLRWGVHLAASLAAEAALDHGQHDGSILRIVKEPSQAMHAAYASLTPSPRWSHILGPGMVPRVAGRTDGPPVTPAHRSKASGGYLGYLGGGTGCPLEVPRAILRSGALDGDMCIFSCVSSVYLRFFGVSIKYRI